MGNVTGLLDQSSALSEAERVEFLGSLLQKEGALGLARLLTSLEAKLGVQRAAGGGGAALPADGGAKKAEAPTSFDVVLKSAGAKKIDVIKVIREVSGLDLMGAKNLAEKGGDVKKGVPKEEADALAKKFKDAGAEVEVKPA
jgi:large subunit ribosomal protein L7/L12